LSVDPKGNTPAPQGRVLPDETGSDGHVEFDARRYVQSSMRCDIDVARSGGRLFHINKNTPIDDIIKKKMII